MPSLKSRILLTLLRNRHLFKGRLTRERWDDESQIPGIRREVEKSTRMFKMPKGVTTEPVSIGALEATWIRPPQPAVDEGVILYFHGGGYVIGSMKTHIPLTAKVVAESRVPALLFGYRQAPEHPFPAAVEDALAAYRFLLDAGTAPSRIVFMGDSAGAGLCLALMMAIKDENLPLPAAAVPLSPWTDVTLSGESHRTRARVCMAPPGSAELFRRCYIGDRDPRNPWISPLFGDLTGLPPLLIFVGDHETMRDDAVRFAEKARAAGVDTTLRVGDGMVHCYPMLAPLFTEATQALAEIGAFIRRRLS